MVHALNVVDTDITSLLAGPGESETLAERGRDAVDSVRKMAKAHDVAIETAVLEGDPADTILEYAEDIDADTMVAARRASGGNSSGAWPNGWFATPASVNGPTPRTEVTVEALADAGYDATITEVKRQLTVWVVHAEADGDDLLVYFDPETQRTSITD